MRYFGFFLLILFVLIRFFSSQSSYQEGDRVRLSGRLTTEPIRYTNSQSVNFARLRIYLPPTPVVSYGDYVVIEGVVSGGKLKNAKLISVKESESIIIKLRQNIISYYRSALPEPHASLVAGIVIGAKSEIPQSFWQGLVNTGTAHVVVASGMNVTLVASFLISVLTLFISRKKAIYASLIGIWLYTVLSGFDAPIVRAAIMGSIAFSAQGLGRLTQAWRALLLSAALMLIVKPDWLTDLGFILSFVATLSLMLFEKKISSLIHFIPSLFREGLSTSLAAQIGVAPIIFFTFGQFNLLSPVVNALILWTIPYIMIIGSLAGIIGLVVRPLGQLIIYLVYPLTSYFIYVIDIFNI